MDRVEERRLLQQAQQGDAPAFGQLYRANVQAIFRYVYHRVGDRHLAEDITGDVFTRALRDLSTYRDRGKPFISWLYRIAHARVVDYYRRVKRRPASSNVDSEPISVTPDMDASLVRQYVAQALQEAIAELTEEQRQVIILRFVEGYRIDAVAEIIEKKPNAVKALQHRALRALAGRLDRAGFDIEAIITGLS